MQKNVGVDADAAGRRPTPPVQSGEWQQTETLLGRRAPLPIGAALVYAVSDLGNSKWMEE